MFDARLFNASQAHRDVYGLYERIYTLIDLSAALCFIVGSALFFSQKTAYAATWLFLVGSVFFAARPLARFGREFHLARLPLPEDGTDGDA